MRCVRPCGPGAVVFLLFQQRCAGLLLEQQRVVQPQCVQLLGVQLLPVQRRCAVVRLRARSRCVSAFSSDALGFCLSSSELFSLNAFSF